MAPPEHESELSPGPRPGWVRVRRTTAVIGLVLVGTLAGTATGAFMLGPEDPPRVAVIEVGQPRADPDREAPRVRPAKERARRLETHRAKRARRRNEQRAADLAEHAPAPGAPVPVPPPAPATAPAPEPAPAVAAPAPPADDDDGESESDDDDDGEGGDD